MTDQVPVTEQGALQRCTCSNCAVETSWIGESGRDKLPVNWVETPSGPACLHCRRELAADAAVSGADLNLAGRARLRHSTIVDFEVKRAPERTNSQIANAIHTSVVAVQKARARIDDAAVVA
jgi:hypothetical protein